MAKKSMVERGVKGGFLFCCASRYFGFAQFILPGGFSLPADFVEIPVRNFAFQVLFSSGNIHRRNTYFHFNFFGFIKTKNRFDVVATDRIGFSFLIKFMLLKRL